MSALLAGLVALATGVGSALLPLVNAEAYAGVAATRSSTLTLVAVVLALAVGQTIGKLVLFESARRASGSRLLSRIRPSARWTGRVQSRLASSRTGPPVVLAAALLGLPPLAAVSLAAGAAGQRRWLFGALCLVGRTARFGVVAAGLAWLSV